MIKIIIPPKTAVGLIEHEDGRTARRDRNRVTVVDALLELFREGNLDPSSDEIAERAGLSARSLFRYFDDLSDLARTAIEAQMARVADLTTVPIEPDWTSVQRLTQVVDRRFGFYEAMGFVGIVARLRAPFQPVIDLELREMRSVWRSQFQSIMAEALSTLAEPAVGEVLRAADILLSFESYQLMRQDHMLSHQACIATATQAVAILLGLDC
jgi:AcrR family transcriptional regulator